MSWRSHIYKDACRLAQAKGLARLIYHELALEVRFARKAMGTTSFLTIRGRSDREDTHQVTVAIEMAGAVICSDLPLNSKLTSLFSAALFRICATIPSGV